MHADHLGPTIWVSRQVGQRKSAVLKSTPPLHPFPPAPLHHSSHCMPCSHESCLWMAVACHLVCNVGALKNPSMRVIEYSLISHLRCHLLQTPTAALKSQTTPAVRPASRQQRSSTQVHSQRAVLVVQLLQVQLLRCCSSSMPAQVTALAQHHALLLWQDSSPGGPCRRLLPMPRRYVQRHHVAQPVPLCQQMHAHDTAPFAQH